MIEDAKSEKKVTTVTLNAAQTDGWESEGKKLLYVISYNNKQNG